MTWNYRIVKTNDVHGNEWYSIREIYYNDQGQIKGYTDGVSAGCLNSDSVEELKETLRIMLEDTEHPVLFEKDLKNIGRDNEKE